MPEPSNCQPGKPFPENPSYILEERVDDGSSTVWRAKKKPNGDQTESGARRYAIKIYESKQDYENEFNALSLLFPSQGKTTELIGIVRPVAWCNEDAKKRKLFYVVEQYYPQRFDDIFVSLAHVASNLGHVRVDELSKRLLFHLAAALNVIHSRQITHNDIRKENVLCDGEQFYLIDFGSAISLSKQKRSSSKLTMRKDITDLGALLFQVWVYPRQEFNHGNVNSAKLPSWLHRLLSEMLDEKRSRMAEICGIRFRVLLVMILSGCSTTENGLH